jgi:DNA-binding PadR family transcriptional regulator
MQEIQLTPTSYIVLGLLSCAPEATPYELKQMVDGSVGHFWSLHRSQLHAEPARLARGGYLTESQEAGGRRRKRYALTERGREALERWRSVPTSEYTELRDLAFLKLFFGADPLAMAQAQLAVLRPLLEDYLGLAKTLERASPGQRQTLRAGIEHVRTSIAIWERIGAEVKD